MKNKLIALLLATICTMTPVVSFAQGEESTQADVAVTADGGEDVIQDESVTALTQNQKLAVELMTAIGAMDKKADLTKNVTRAEFAHAIYYASGCLIQSQSAASVYGDINSESAYLNEISAALDMGYMSGDSGVFRPDDNITFVEASAVLINLLGVRYIAETSGGYPQGFLNLVGSYGIYDDLDTSKPALSTLDMAVMLKNLFEVEITDNTYSTTNIKGYYMTSVHDIVRVKGMITDNGYATLDGSEPTTGQIKIGNKSYYVDGISTRNLLGKMVMAYCSETKGDGNKLFAAVILDDQESLYISGDDLVSYANRVYTYKDGDRRKTAQLELEHNVIYNGRLVTDGTLLTRDRMLPGEGSVELIDTDDNGRYETVIIDYFETFVVNEYNLETTKLTSTNGQKAIVFDDADVCLEMYMCQGDVITPITYQNINHYGYALSVARSFDDKIVEIYFSADHRIGVVDGVNTSKRIFTIDGEEFKAAKTVDLSLGFGESAEFYFNQFGHIIHWKRQGSNTIKYAYVERYYLDERAENLYMKMYTQDGIYLTAKLKSSVTIDSRRVDGVTAQKTALDNASVTNNIVGYQLNAKDELSWIDTMAVRPEEDSSNSLNIVYKNESTNESSAPALDYGMYAWGERYASKYPASPNSVVFVAVPDKSESVRVFTLEDFKTNYASSSENVVGTSLLVLNTDTNSMIGTMALVKCNAMKSVSTGASTALRYGAIVTNIIEGLTNDGEPAYMLDVQMGDNKDTITIPAKLLSFNSTTGKYSQTMNDCTISLGDMVRWVLDFDGKIDEGCIMVMFDRDTEVLISSGGGNMTSSLKRDAAWHYLWAYDREDAFMITVNDKQTSLEAFIAGEKTRAELYTYVDYIEPINSSRTNVYVYDDDGGLRLSDMGEIRTYTEDDAAATKFLGRFSTNGGHRMIIVYK